ncbi:histidine kinase, partial [Paraburkholderia sp. SIMBA_049]
WLNHSPHGDDLSAQTKSQLDQGVEIANARGGLSLLIKCAPIRPSAFGERALVFHVADVSSVRLAERQRDMVLRFLSHDMRSPQASIL